MHVARFGRRFRRQPGTVHRSSVGQPVGGRGRRTRPRGGGVVGAVPGRAWNQHQRFQTQRPDRRSTYARARALGQSGAGQRGRVVAVGVDGIVHGLYPIPGGMSTGTFRGKKKGEGGAFNSRNTPWVGGDIPYMALIGGDFGYDLHLLFFRYFLVQ